MQGKTDGIVTADDGNEENALLSQFVWGILLYIQKSLIILTNQTILLEKYVLFIYSLTLNAFGVFKYVFFCYDPWGVLIIPLIEMSCLI